MKECFFSNSSSFLIKELRLTIHILLKFFGDPFLKKNSITHSTIHYTLCLFIYLHKKKVEKKVSTQSTDNQPVIYNTLEINHLERSLQKISNGCSWCITHKKWTNTKKNLTSAVIRYSCLPLLFSLSSSSNSTFLLLFLYLLDVVMCNIQFRLCNVIIQKTSQKIMLVLLTLVHFHIYQKLTTTNKECISFNIYFHIFKVYMSSRLFVALCWAISSRETEKRQNAIGKSKYISLHW